MSCRISLYHVLFFLVIVALVASVGISWLQGTKKDESRTLKNEKNKAMPELLTLDSGLQYMILNHGTGQTTPTPGAVATVNYTGWLSDGGQPGKQFDSSVGRGPFSFVVGVGQVIKGWDEAVLQMRTGEKRRIILPPQLAYGSRGVPGAIPPNATLIFDVELISFK